MKAELINPFINATLNVLKTMAQTNATPGKPGLKANNLTSGAVTGVIGMASEALNGNMVISFDQPSILAIVARMLMEEHKEINKDVIDAVGELTNMISGGAKKELSEMGFAFNMATPLMLTGQNIEMTQLSKSPIIVIPFTTPEGKFSVEANLAPAK